MAYRYGDREQTQILPASVEEYVPEDAPVRVYDAFVEALSFKDLGIVYNPNQTGNPEYDPKAMLKLLVYGYSYGVRSSRRLEREACYNLSFIWLIGGLRPDHKTIAEFRRRHKPALQQVLKQCARMCLKLNLIAGNTLFVDGTKLRANAGWRTQWNQERGRKALAKIDERIATLLAECEAVDQDEAASESFVKISKELLNKQTLKAKIETVLQELKEPGDRVNTADPESVPMHSTKGTFPSYNAQQVVDSQHGLIVSADVVTDATDIYQFAEHPFGHLRRNLGVQSFLLRGIEGVRAEMSILATCFNLARMITLLGVPALLRQLVILNQPGT